MRLGLAFRLATPRWEATATDLASLFVRVSYFGNTGGMRGEAGRQLANRSRALMSSAINPWFE
jgi:hypothetical protein